MNKNMVAALVALIIVLGCGIAEVVVLNNRYQGLEQTCDILLSACEAETLTEEQFEEFQKEWLDLRETSELLLPHIDVYELNLRVAETDSYVKAKDYKSAHAQLSIVDELLRYIPHLMIPDFKHIV
ncbi:MAG: DUF4363 family protein [Corallococcus sp.]|nr:DUF4363 family protein [Corallococcus sp.]